MPVKNRRGFSLIEIVLTLFLILALITILLTASGVLKHFRNAYLQATATRIASRKVESLRQITNWPTDLPPNGQFADEDLSKLPVGETYLTLSDYPGADSNLKLATITVSWTEKGAYRNIKVETLVTKNGL